MAETRSLNRVESLAAFPCQCFNQSISTRALPSFRGESAIIDRSTIRQVHAVAADVAFFFSAAMSVFAAGPDDCGFCPVMSWPSLTT